jgi:hypothetical protein
VILAVAIAIAAPLAIVPIADRVGPTGTAAEVARVARAAEPPLPRPEGGWPGSALLAAELGVDPVSVTYLLGTDGRDARAGEATGLMPR